MMTSLQVRELGKAYNIYVKPIDYLKELLFRRSYHNTFWALQGINFNLLHGISLGVVGENGSGKTTLLQLLAGTIAPTCGTVDRNGRISAILELGSGFQPDLSGLENIKLGCATLGLSLTETAHRIPEIIAFSELEDFMDRPVKTFSTGMHARLAFSVATSVDPDILVVDEALAVGDQHFQKKSIDRMMGFREQGKTLIFCSHNLYYIQQVCDLCLWLRNGRPERLGPAMEVTERYQDYLRTLDAKTTTSPPVSVFKKDTEESKKDSYLLDVTLEGDCREGSIETGGNLIINVSARLAMAARKEGAHLGILIVRNDMVWCYGVSTQMDDVSLYPLSEEEYGVRLVMERLPLLAGEYSLDIYLIDNRGMHAYDAWKGTLSFKVHQNTKEVGVARLHHRWERP